MFTWQRKPHLTGKEANELLSHKDSILKLGHQLLKTGRDFEPSPTEKKPNISNLPDLDATLKNSTESEALNHVFRLYLDALLASNSQERNVTAIHILHCATFICHLRALNRYNEEQYPIGSSIVQTECTLPISRSTESLNSTDNTTRDKTLHLLENSSSGSLQSHASDKDNNLEIDRTRAKTSSVVADGPGSYIYGDSDFPELLQQHANKIRKLLPDHIMVKPAGNDSSIKLSKKTSSHYKDFNAVFYTCDSQEKSLTVFLSQTEESHTSPDLAGNYAIVNALGTRLKELNNNKNRIRRSSCTIDLATKATSKTDGDKESQLTHLKALYTIYQSRNYHHNSTLRQAVNEHALLLGYNIKRYNCTNKHELEKANTFFAKAIKNENTRQASQKKLSVT